MQRILGTCIVTLWPDGFLKWEHVDTVLALLRASKFGAMVSKFEMDLQHGNVRVLVALGKHDCSSVDDGSEQLTNIFSGHFNVEVAPGELSRCQV